VPVWPGNRILKKFVFFTLIHSADGHLNKEDLRHEEIQVVV
jgi:hypothetical protein